MNHTIPTIQIVQLQPGDVIVASHAGTLTAAMAHEIKQRIEARFPNHPVLVHDERCALTIHRPPP